MANAKCSAVGGICIKKNKHFTKSNCTKCKRYAVKNKLGRYKKISLNEID